TPNAHWRTPFGRSYSNSGTTVRVPGSVARPERAERPLPACYGAYLGHPFAYRDMPLTLIVEQLLNGVQLGLMLFLLAAGLTLVFGIMDMINLAHGSLYMIGAYLAATATQASGSFLLGLAAAVVGTALVGVALERTLLRRLYRQSHLAQVLATFAVILIANEIVRMIWGSQPIMLNTPAVLSGP